MGLRGRGEGVGLERNTVRPQPKNTVRFVALGKVVRTTSLRHGETHNDAAARVGIYVGGRKGFNESVRLAEFNGVRGEVRYA